MRSRSNVSVIPGRHPPGGGADTWRQDVSPKLADLMERAGWTAGQQFLAVLLATSAADSAVDLPWKLASSMAAGAAIVSVATTLLQYVSGLTTLDFWQDVLVRLVKTFLASLIASFGADAFDAWSFDWSGAIDLAVVATLGALGKGLLARGPSAAAQGNPSTLPPSTYTLVIAPS
jgi:hypothetical protein